MERPRLARRALMEGIGAFAIVFAGCGDRRRRDQRRRARRRRRAAIGVFGYELVRGAR